MGRIKEGIIMKVALVSVDGKRFPNLALMKIAAWHKSRGDYVWWYDSIFGRPDKIYASKVFTFTPDFMGYADGHPKPIQGGTGYGLNTLPPEIEAMPPDYTIYPQYPSAYGFLTRGCIRACSWCVVPRKEGDLHIVNGITQVASDRRDVVLLDNNFLAAPDGFVREQLEKARILRLRIDFNQGLDARLVSDWNARLLASTPWIRYIRFSCDTEGMREPVARAIRLIRSFGYTREFFVYVLSREVKEAHARIVWLASLDRKVYPFCQPYRNLNSDEPIPHDLKRLARWCNIQSIRKTVAFKDYKPR